jgi:transposase InsO family protein
VKFGFIEAEKARYPVAMLCETLEVSRSGFYAWRSRPPSLRKREDAKLEVHILKAFEKSARRHGSPRIQRDLRDGGIRIGRRRTSRLMRQQDLVARPKRVSVRTTMSEHEHPTAPNVLARDFTASRPNEKWVGDITYLPTAEGFIYLAILMDLHSRRIVGWSVSNTMETSLVLRALEMAIATRELDKPLVHHTDRGVQYASKEYTRRLRRLSVVQSMSRKGNCWDNAPAESFFSTLKFELPEVIDGRRTRLEVRRAVVEYVAWYNLERRHSSIGYISPVAFEHAAQQQRAA